MFVRIFIIASCIAVPIASWSQQQTSPPTYDNKVALKRHKKMISNSVRKHCGDGMDFLDGGEGTDTAVYPGKRSDYKITRHPDGSYTIKDLVPCRSETDTVINCERFQFKDGVFTERELGYSPAE